MANNLSGASGQTLDNYAFKFRLARNPLKALNSFMLFERKADMIGSFKSALEDFNSCNHCRV